MTQTNPDHYTNKDIEPIEVIEDWELDFHLGNVVKYVGRHKEKNGREDLEKALWYIQRYLEVKNNE